MSIGSKIAAVAGAAVVTVFSAAGAQAQVFEQLKFSTTFAFSAGHSNLPPGTYTIRPLDMTTGVMELTSDSGATSRFIVVTPAGLKGNEKTGDEVVFKKSGDTYVLTEIRDGAEGTGVDLAQVKLEEPGARHHGSQR
jgi:hypothetical protein